MRGSASIHVKAMSGMSRRYSHPFSKHCGSAKASSDTALVAPFWLHFRSNSGISACEHHVRSSLDSVAKLQKWLSAFFFAKRAAKRRAPIDVPLSALPKLPVSSLLVAGVARMIIRSLRPQPGKFVFGDPKRVLQHYRLKNRPSQNERASPFRAH
jgi:hypothetical protein